MGSVSLKIGDGTARFRRSTLCSSALHLLMLASVLTTNLFALYAFTSKPQSSSSVSPSADLLSHQISSILREIDLSERKLHQIERELSGYDSLDPTLPTLPPELKLFLARHPLPLGRDSRSGITELVSSVAHSCSHSLPLLSQFMSYKPFSPCPSADSHLPLKLLSSACDPLPRRRCLSRSRPRPLLPPSLNQSRPWSKPRGKNDFLIDDVLSLAAAGPAAIRIGLDFGGLTADGDFAAAMAERNVTVITSAVNVEAVAAKGVFPLMESTAQRFPFYDSVFDLVHTMQGLDDGGAEGMGKGRVEAMEFLMFDVDRVLRAGGLFWLDNYLCVDDERKRAVTRLIERFGYKKLKWVVGEKVDGNSGKGKPQVYLSAVLQKPARG